MDTQNRENETDSNGINAVLEIGNMGRGSVPRLTSQNGSLAVSKWELDRLID